ncbi:hypothetical protein ID866_3204 [Astraeus odoratus]|nr:hypothetical protein ID866_3204 [Astraeus odoratus]
MPVPVVPVAYDTLPRSTHSKRRRAYSTTYAYRPAPGFGHPIYPQVTAHYAQPQPQPQPQYAPVQVAFVPQPQQQVQPVQPVQPILTMPQAYVPVTAAAPVAAQPAIVQVAPTMHPRQPVQPMAQVPPPVGHVRMPDPISIHASQPQPRVIPPMPGQAEPVIPPPPVMSEPRTPRASRRRFTDFYRPADPPPIAMPHVDRDPDMPYRPHSAAPIADPTRHNPLPTPPADIWERTPYRQVLDNLPRDVSQILSVENAERVPMEIPAPPPAHHPSLLGSLFGSRKDKGKSRSRGGLLRSHSTARTEMHGDPGPSSRHGHHRVPTVTNIVIPPEDGARAPPIKFNHIGDLGGFVNHSPHRILFRNKTYPSALHLLEAMKFVDKPDIAERIRLALDANEVYRLSTQYHEHVRPDWGQMLLKTLDDVLYLKFKQHPNLRKLLLNTGFADIIFADPHDFYGEGPSGSGANELGKALVRVRDRLRREGER